jgi:hypothetical protein
MICFAISPANWLAVRFFDVAFRLLSRIYIVDTRLGDLKSRSPS